MTQCSFNIMLEYILNATIRLRVVKRTPKSVVKLFILNILLNMVDDLFLCSII